MRTTMIPSTDEKGRASQAPAGTIHRAVDYPNAHSRSRRKLLEQAAEVLCLLVFFPVTETARTVLFALLERRIERVYEGASDERAGTSI
jgi:hypothetical protein